MKRSACPFGDFQNPGGLIRATVTYPGGVTSTDWFLPGTVSVSHAQRASSSHHGWVPAPYCGTYSFKVTVQPGLVP